MRPVRARPAVDLAGRWSWTCGSLLVELTCLFFYLNCYLCITALAFDRAPMDHGRFGMAAEPDEFHDTVEQWPRLTTPQRAAVVQRLVMRSRSGDPVTEQMVALLGLLAAGKSGPGQQGAGAAGCITWRTSTVSRCG